MAFEENRMRDTHGMRTPWMLHVAGMFGSLVTDATFGPLQLMFQSLPYRLVRMNMLSTLGHL